MKRKQIIEDNADRLAVVNLMKQVNARKVSAYSIQQPATKKYVTTCKKNEREFIRESACYADAYLSAADYYVE